MRYASHEIAEAKVRIAREVARKRRGPDASLRSQIRDPKECLSAFDVLRRHFGR